MIDTTKGTILLLIVFSLSGCSGCSDSSKRYRANKDLPNTHNQETATLSKLNPVSKSESNPEDVRSKSILTDILPLDELFEKNKRAVFVVYLESDEEVIQGSGFFVSNTGIGVSNYHVFEGKLKGTELIETYEGLTYKIDSVLSKSKEHDYIIFRLKNLTGNPYLKVANNESKIGENVFTISNPRGLNHTLSTGIVSSYREGNSLIQSTAEITYGSSGGALMNMRGEVIGITTSGIGEANLNFAINIQVLSLENYVNK